MMLTTKGRYAVMAMADLASCCKGSPVTLSYIADRQGIALAYLEQIFAKLKKNELVKSTKGPGGGYVLAKDSTEIKISDIIMAVDESIKMTRCSHEKEAGCVDGKKCVTHDLWEGLGNHIYGYLRAVSLSDVCNRKIISDAVFTNISAEQIVQQ